MRIKKAVIPAAGLGTRFLPVTKAQPKEMLPILDKPVIQYIVEEAVASGIEDVLIITGRGKRAIEDHFDTSYELEHTLEKKGKYLIADQLKQISLLANIYYVRQREPIGLGHAITYAKGFVGNEPFGVLLGDDLIYSAKPILRQLMEVYEKYHGSVIAVQEVNRENISKYGIVSMTDMGSSKSIFQIADLVEKPSPDEAPSNLAIIGRYILTPEIFNILYKMGPGSGGEIQLTDALRIMRQQQTIMGLRCQGRRYDIGNLMGFLEANIDYALQKKSIRGELLNYMNSKINYYKNK